VLIIQYLPLKECMIACYLSQYSSKLCIFFHTLQVNELIRLMTRPNSIMLHTRGSICKYFYLEVVIDSMCNLEARGYVAEIARGVTAFGIQIVSNFLK
jgi:hypothetical protein